MKNTVTSDIFIIGSNLISYCTAIYLDIMKIKTTIIATPNYFYNFKNNINLGDIFFNKNNIYIDDLFNSIERKTLIKKISLHYDIIIDFNKNYNMFIGKKNNYISKIFLVEYHNLINISGINTNFYDCSSIDVFNYGELYTNKKVAIFCDIQDFFYEILYLSKFVSKLYVITENINILNNAFFYYLFKHKNIKLFFNCKIVKIIKKNKLDELVFKELKSKHLFKINVSKIFFRDRNMSYLNLNNPLFKLTNGVYIIKTNNIYNFSIYNNLFFSSCISNKLLSIID